MDQDRTILGVVLVLGIGGAVWLVAAIVALCKSQWRKAGRRFVAAVFLFFVGYHSLQLLGLGCRERGRRARCGSNLHQIGLACKMYSMDHHEELPPSFRLLKDGYADDPKLFICPHTSHAPGSMTDVDEWTDYAYVTGLKETDPAKCVLGFCPPVNHAGNGANVLHCDASVEWCEPERFAALTGNPTLFFGATNTVLLAEIQSRARIVRGARQIGERR